MDRSVDRSIYVAPDVAPDVASKGGRSTGGGSASLQGHLTVPICICPQRFKAVDKQCRADKDEDMPNGVKRPNAVDSVCKPREVSGDHQDCADIGEDGGISNGSFHELTPLSSWVDRSA